MPSIAEKVAYKVVESSEQGKHLSIVQAAKQAGVTSKYATSGNLAKTQAFQKVIAQFREKTAKALVKHVNRSAKELIAKDLSNVSYEKLVVGIDTGIKNVQLLTGGTTSETPQPIINVVNFVATQSSETVKKDANADVVSIESVAQQSQIV